MVPDNELPIWSFRANWSDPVLERLTWMTDVLASSYGTEQRRALRLSPRREFEIKFNPVDEARSYFELFLHRYGSQEFMVPLYHDAAKLADAVSPGPGTLPFATSYREFVAGGLALIMGDDPFSCDVVNITAVNLDGIDVTGVSKSWPKGTTVHPLRRARVEQESALTAITTHVGDATLLFQLNQSNDIPDEGVWPLLFNGYPVLTDKPNRRENVDLTLARNSLILDNDHGLRELDDDAGRAFTIQSHMTMQRGLAEHWAFRQFLYRLRGQQGSIWIPTFNHDIRLSRPYTAGDAALKVKKLGYALTGGATSGRRFVHFFKEGTLGQITGTGVAPSGTEESLTLSAPLAVSLAAGRIASFMDTCRLAGDQVEITHHTSTDGVAECNLSWRSFRDERTIPNPIEARIPYALKSVDPCGTPFEEVCVPDLAPGSTGGATDGTGEPPPVPVGDGDGGFVDPTVTGSTLMAIVVRSPVPKTGTGPFGAVESPGDVAGAPYLMLVPASLARTQVLVDFPELASLPWTAVGSSFFYGTLNEAHGNSGLILPGDTGPHGPAWGWSGGNEFVWYHNQNPPFWDYGDMWWSNGGAYSDYLLYSPELNDPNAYLAAEGGPYQEHAAWWDAAHTIPKTLRGKGAILTFHDPHGVNPDQPAQLPPDTMPEPPPFGEGNYDLTSFDFKKYYGGYRP